MRLLDGVRSAAVKTSADKSGGGANPDEAVFDQGDGGVEVADKDEAGDDVGETEAIEGGQETEAKDGEAEEGGKSQNKEEHAAEEFDDSGHGRFWVEDYGNFSSLAFM